MTKLTLETGKRYVTGTDKIVIIQASSRDSDGGVEFLGNDGVRYRADGRLVSSIGATEADIVGLAEVIDERVETIVEEETKPGLFTRMKHSMQRNPGKTAAGAGVVGAGAGAAAYSVYQFGTVVLRRYPAAAAAVEVGTQVAAFGRSLLA